MDGARLLAEKEFHDRQAAERAQTFARNPELLTVVDNSYLDHESWIRPALARLGPLRGLRVLDFGCGHAMASVVMARQGASVVAFDLSPGYLAEASRRAAFNQVGVRFLRADGDRLPLATASFDRIWGNAILHHLDLPRAAREIARVLKPGGCAVFCEPWGENWLLRLARGRLAYEAKARTVDERPLRERDLECFTSHFAQVEVQGYQLLSMINRFLGQRRTFAGLDRCDKLLLDRMPRLRRYCRYVVMTLGQPRTPEPAAAEPTRNRQHAAAEPIPVTCASEP